MAQATHFGDFALRAQSLPINSARGMPPQSPQSVFEVNELVRVASSAQGFWLCLRCAVAWLTPHSVGLPDLLLPAL